MFFGRVTTPKINYFSRGGILVGNCETDNPISAALDIANSCKLYCYVFKYVILDQYTCKLRIEILKIILNQH